MYNIILVSGVQESDLTIIYVTKYSQIPQFFKKQKLLYYQYILPFHLVYISQRYFPSSHKELPYAS